jgi:hypothetical protein
MDGKLAVRTESVLDAGAMFDVPAAMRLASEISQLPAAAQVVIDFVRTRECHDFALAVLSQALIRMGRTPQVKARGLTTHHTRVLRYLGNPGCLLA